MIIKNTSNADKKILSLAFFSTPGAAFVTAMAAIVCSHSLQAQQLEEVVVSATKRDKLITDVPVAITAVGGEKLEQKGIFDVRDIFYVAPSVSFNSSVNPGGDTLKIRGVGSPGFAAGVEQSVSSVIDGVVTGSSGSGLSALWDIDRIEVLRGPQGTLFGKNTSAGAINIITRAPTSEFESYVTIRYRDKYDSTRTEAGISGPVSDNMRARISGFYSDDGNGVVDEVVRESEANTRRGQGLRLRMDYMLDATTADLSLSYNKNDNKCCTVTFTDYDAQLLALNLPATGTANNLVNVLAPLYGIDIDKDNRKSIADAPDRASEEIWHMALNLSHELDDGKVLKSITGYRSWNEQDRTDSEKLPIDLVNNTNTTRDLKLYTQEFQLLSAPDSDLEYVAGLYFFHQQFDEVQNTGGGLGNDIAEMRMDVSNAAVFGQATYHFNEQWQTFAGLRLLWEEFDIIGQRYDDPGTGGLPLAAFLFDGGDDITQSDTDWAGTAGVQYQPTDDSMYYASVSRGYKGAGVDTAPSGSFFSANIETSPVLDPETVVSYELGAKLRWFDGRLGTNFALFHSEFEDFHASSFDSSSNGILLRNAGVIIVKGLELDASLLLWERAVLDFSAAYLDAEFDEYQGAPCTTRQSILDGCTSQDLSGKAVNNAPEFQYNITFRQDFDFPGTQGAYFAADYAWRDEFVFNGDLDPFTTQDAYGVANLRIGAKISDHFDVMAFVENAGDTDYALRILPAPVVAGAYSAQVATERTFGVELRWQY